MKIGKKNASSWLNAMLILTLFCVFAVSALLYTLFGARAYKNIVTRSEQSFQMHIPLAYLEGRIRSADAEGAVYVEPGAEGDILCLDQAFGDRMIQTRIYTHKGQLYELTALPGASVLPEHGQPIFPLSKLSIIELSPGLLRLDIQTEDGNENSAIVYLRASGQ
jgi:hypothetical protein